MAPTLRAEEKVRYAKNIKINGQFLQAKISQTRGSWNVSLVEKKNEKVLLKSTIPEWVASDYYDYSIDSRTIDGYPIIVFEATPSTKENAPQNADILQFAWMRKDTQWKTIASTQTSMLEGTDQLKFRKENAKLALVRIQSKNSNLFCGDRLGVYKVFNPKDDTFESKLRLASLLKDAQKLTPTVPASTYVPSFFYSRFSQWSYASSKRNHVPNGTLIRPDKLGDGSLKTFWSQGRRESNRGEFVTTRLNDALKVTGFRIFPGAGTSEESFLANAKPTKILASLSNGTRFQIELPGLNFETLKKSGGLVVNFPKPIRSSCLSLVILESTLSSGPTSISEISPMTDLDGRTKSIAASVVVERLLGVNQPRINRKLAQLMHPIRNELATILTDTLRTGSDADRKRIIPLLRDLPSDTALPILVQLFEDLPVKDPSYRMLKPLLAAHATSGPALIEIYENRQPKNTKKQIDLIRLLGRTKGNAGPTTLLKSIGVGDLDLRHEKIRSIARGGETMLLPLFSIANKNQNTPQSEDALTTINKISKHLFRKQKGKLTNQKITNIFEKSKTRKLRALAAKTASYFSFDGDFDFFQKLLSNQDPFIRKFGVQGMTYLATESSRLSLEEALRDPSPDVRIEAILALSKRKDRTKSTTAIVGFVEREKWKQGLRLGCATLSEVGNEIALKTLGGLVIRNQPNASAIAAREMVKTRRALPFLQIEKLLMNQKTDLRLIFTLIEMLGLNTKETNEKLLLKVITDKNFLEKHDERSRYKIKKRAIFALGRQQSRTGADALFDLLQIEPNGSKTQATILRAFAFQNDPWVLRELKNFGGGMSASTKGIFQETLDAIQRRIDIKKLSDSIDETP